MRQNAIHGDIGDRSYLRCLKLKLRGGGPRAVRGAVGVSEDETMEVDDGTYRRTLKLEA